MQRDNGTRWPLLESCHARLGLEGKERSVLSVLGPWQGRPDEDEDDIRFFTGRVSDAYR